MLDTCAVCQKAIPTVHVLELEADGGIADEKHLCPACAESAGLVQPKHGVPMKISPELLEDLIGLKSQPQSRAIGPACPGCGMTANEFKTSGRLGCARCYTAFKATLLPVLERVHDATSHRGRLPGPANHDSGGLRLAELRRLLSDAINGERYEEAARLRDRLQSMEQTPEEQA